MITINQKSALTPSNRIKLYFTDFDLSGKTVFGNNYYRNLWIIGCYLFFSLGVYARQIIYYTNTDITYNISKNNLTTFISAFVIGLAIFPFALRTIAKLVTRIFAIEPLKQRGKLGFNMMHIFSSFTIGYFFNLIAQQIPVIIEKLL